LATEISEKSGSVPPSGHKGFTLVELVIASVMSGIVMAGLFIVVSGPHTYIIKGREKTKLQQDFSLIDQVLANNIRKSSYGKQEIYNSYSDYIDNQPAQSSGSCLKLYFQSGDSTLLYKDSTDFKIQEPDLSFTTLVAGILSNLVFTQATRSMQIALTLKIQSGDSINSNLVHTFRNINEAPPDTT